MNNKLVIENLFNSWKNRDYEVIENICSKDFSLRDRFLYSNLGSKESLTYFKKQKLINYELLNFTEGNETVYFNSNSNFEINGQLFNVKLHYKISFIDGLIYKVFEEEKNNSLKRIKCVVAYDGTSFFGFQKQQNDITIQSKIEEAICKVSKEKVNIHSSGRTDAGVHALNQVFHFDTSSVIDSEKWRIVINANLPKSILIKDSIRVPQSFHSRYDSVSKEYMYIINTKEYTPTNRNYEWFVKDIDIKRLKLEVSKIVGAHDFRSFAKVSDDVLTTREILEASVEVIDDKIKIYLRGTGFLRYMVRNIVGVLVDISTQNTTLDILEVINKRDRDFAKNTAPACGLYLKEVKY